MKCRGGRLPMWRFGYVSLVLAVLWGCTISADENEVVIEHPANQPGVAEFKADNHCAKFGKVAERVQLGIQKTTYLWLRGRISVFECVDKARDTGAGKGTP